MKPSRLLIPTAVILMLLLAALVVWAREQDLFTYLPLITSPEPTPAPTVEPTVTPTPESLVEFRGLWVSRYDWATSNPTSEKIDEIVDNAALAGFNAIFFQVRGEGDAYYNSQHEPWSRHLAGTLGADPGWDPLAYLIEKAQAKNIQIHAYINIYALWLSCTPPPDNTTPLHLYHRIVQEHGATDGKPNGLQWNSSGDVICNYYRSSPASSFVDDHLLAVAADLAANYDIDGIHLDHIRYGGATTSCDPVSAAAYGGSCFSDAGYEDWQRAQVNGTVNKFYEQLTASNPEMMLSAAVWFDYTSGYHNYYQDPRSWMLGGYIDAVSQMIYPSGSFDLDYWEAEVAGLMASANGRFVIPGIGSEWDCAPLGSEACRQEIESRILKAREMETDGHAIFSYGGLLAHGFFDDLAADLYAETAVPPTIDRAAR